MVGQTVSFYGGPGFYMEGMIEKKANGILSVRTIDGDIYEVSEEEVVYMPFEL